MPDASHTTRLLRAATRGEPGAADQLLPALYNDLHGVADRLLRGERVGHTLQPTALIHEAWLRLIETDGVDEADQAEFTRLAARAMRQVLVDHARTRGAQKRGGDRLRTVLDEEASAPANAPLETVLDVHEGLERLSTVDPQLGQIVELRFFAGLTLEEIAATLGVSRRTVDRGWRVARAWWSSELGPIE